MPVPAPIYMTGVSKYLCRPFPTGDDDLRSCTCKSGNLEKLPGYIHRQTISDPFVIALLELASTISVLASELLLLLGTIDDKYFEQHPVYGRPNGVVPWTTATHSSRANPSLTLLQLIPSVLGDVDGC